MEIDDPPPEIVYCHFYSYSFLLLTCQNHCLNLAMVSGTACDSSVNVVYDCIIERETWKRFHYLRPCKHWQTHESLYRSGRLHYRMLLQPILLQYSVKRALISQSKIDSPINIPIDYRTVSVPHRTRRRSSAVRLSSIDWGRMSCTPAMTTPLLESIDIYRTLFDGSETLSIVLSE